MSGSRYARRSEALSPRFMEVNMMIDAISSSHSLPDHSEENRRKFPWADCLHHPEFYASRLWEYPWAALESHLSPGLRVADVGCGQSPFPIYLKEAMGCDVTGFDPDYRMSPGYVSFGVTEEYVRKTGINFVASDARQIDAPDASFDRVFCISVLEHLPRKIDRAESMREMARILKPGGFLFITVDVNLKQRIVNPLDLAWESGLSIAGSLDLTMPEERFAIFTDGVQPADVFGLALKKPRVTIATDYGQSEPLVEAWRVAYLRDTNPPEWNDDNPPYPEGLQQLVNDVGRDLRNDGRPSLKTAARVLVKTFMRRYPPSSRER